MDVASNKEEEQKLLSKNVTRYKKRYMKRQWEDNNRKIYKEGEEKKHSERIKRKKMAMLLGYCGVDYYGMQRNPGVRTIEEDLLKALFDAKYISEEDFNNQQNAHFQRSSRTDKGVSAARQVVSLKLPLEVNIEEINTRLPDCIKVFGVKRVTNKFNSKVKCNARTYSYTLPTYVFEAGLETELQRKQYRITPQKLEKINTLLGFYKGTKSYHNFTEKKHYQDPSASRYMMSFSIEKVFVESDMEFAVLLVKGQSFMLHQIRKMIGLTIAVMRGHGDMSVMDKAFGKDKVMIPTAPGLGLVLDMVHYERYDNKFKDSHDSLTWEAEEDTVQKFKHEYIYPNIVKGEIEGNSMGLWLEKLKGHSYDPTDHVPGEKDGDDETEMIGDDDDDDGTADDGDDDEKDKPEPCKKRKTGGESSIEDKDDVGKKTDAESNIELESDVNVEVNADTEKKIEVKDNVEKKSEAESNDVINDTVTTGDNVMDKEVKQH